MKPNHIGKIRSRFWKKLKSESIPVLKEIMINEIITTKIRPRI